MKDIDRRILKIAIPSTVAGITVPLLGLADTAITGHLGAASYLGAIAVGSSIFSICYWGFGFLRMATGGLTAQAYGRHDGAACNVCLRKAMTIALVCGLALIALQWPVFSIAMLVMDASPEVERLAWLYFSILVWGAPANLCLSALNGWFIGLHRAKAMMTVAIVQNVLNIIVSLTLVAGLHWKVEGVATGTLIAQWTGCFVALWLARSSYARHSTPPAELQTAELQTAELQTADHGTMPWRLFFRTGRDIFLRTLLIVSVMFSFTAFGAREGDTCLAVNAIIMQLFLLVSYVMDGISHAGEAIGGSLYGRRDHTGFLRLANRLFVWGGAASLLFILTYAFAGEAIVSLLTDSVEVRLAAHSYLWAAIAIPFVSLAAFIFDGLFIGAAATREMLISALVATSLFFLFAWVSDSNSGLWLAFLTYLSARGITLFFLLPQVMRRG